MTLSLKQRQELIAALEREAQEFQRHQARLVKTIERLQRDHVELVPLFPEHQCQR